MLRTDARRITGLHPLLDGPGTAMELTAVPPGPERERALRRIETRLDIARARLADPERGSRAVTLGALTVHHGKSGVQLGFTCPVDLLYAAALLLDWAASDTPEDGDELGEVLVEFDLNNLHLRSLYLQISATPCFFDDDGFTVGLGARSRTYPLDQLPGTDALPTGLGPVPLALITGTNGKTTTTRLLARVLGRAGPGVGYTCSDGIVVDEAVVEQGDWTGSGAARLLLRHPDVRRAVLETARGGLLRRGLVVGGAEVAVITNVSADHLGDYGLSNLDDLAWAKLGVARGLRPGGTLVVHAGSLELVRALSHLQRPDLRILTFADSERLPQLPERGLDAALVGDAFVVHGEAWGHVAELPLTWAGAARYNAENALAVALAALALGEERELIWAGLRSFRPSVAESRGRSNMFALANGGRALFDFAHNAESLRRLGELIGALAPDSVVVVLGHAGDRREEDYAEVAAEIVKIRPRLVVLKELPEHARDRRPAEVPQLFRRCLRDLGLGPAQMVDVPDEVEAVAYALEHTGAGELALLLVHEEAEAVLSLLGKYGATELEA